MIGILEGLALGLVILTVIYVVVRIYARSVHRERLEKEFDAGGVAGDRTAFIEAGLEAYSHSLRRRMIVLIYVIPALAVAVIIYRMNGN